MIWLKFWHNRNKYVRINFEDGGEIEELRIVGSSFFTASGYTVNDKGEDVNLTHITISRVQVLTEIGEEKK